MSSTVGPRLSRRGTEPWPDIQHRVAGKVLAPCNRMLHSVPFLFCHCLVRTHLKVLTFYNFCFVSM